MPGDAAPLPAPDIPQPAIPTQPPWLWPAVMIATSLVSLGIGWALPPLWQLSILLPYTYLGNSLAPLPYDGMVIYHGTISPIWQVVVIGVIGTVIVEAWNIELLNRILARDSTRGFRGHRLTRWSLRMYQRAPFWSLVGTCIVPIIPHYPMRVLVVLDRYPMWKYQTSVILGRGGRYTWLALLGWTIPIPGSWIAVASLTILLFGIRGARRMNDREPAPAIKAS